MHLEWYDFSELLIGKVVLRIPCVGHIALFMRNSYGIYLVVFPIILIVIAEFAIPEFSHQKPETRPMENTSEAYGPSY